MKLWIDPPPGFVAVPLKGAVLLIPERVYVAGLRLGKRLTRQALAKRLADSEGDHVQTPPDARP